jgi:hypothetical protein
VTITRRRFLAGTTAFTSPNLYATPAARVEDVAVPRGWPVWFRPVAASQESTPAPMMIDAQTMARLKSARPGDGLKGSVTTHIMRDKAPEFFG